MGAWIAVVWIVGFGYIAITYAESYGRIPARSFGAVVRSVLTEAWYVAWTQPLLPVFQVMTDGDAHSSMPSPTGILPAPCVSCTE